MSDWYKDAIIYQLHVKGFFDSNGDGIGDFPGLVQKLDYLKDLGVTCLWLLPFYVSPLKDDGYDIADYYHVHPDFGTLEQFEVFLEQAHRHGIRVITELVLNHTSDQHQWFAQARQPGSPYHDYYVWSDTDERYQGARIIFRDIEISNWTWDPVAKAYYWHRFFSHQPDLNYDNPRVQEAMLNVVRFWLDRGVDGLRCDAVPYLFEREGTNCENLPETHAYIRRLRRFVDERYEDRVLIAEANQPPPELQTYFGNGDEFHMAFQFSLMPRLFIALHQEDRQPIVDVIRATPEPPAGCQWVLFLRNHDELTLEMVSDEERAYMQAVYAADRRMILNLGIRRRLAPLLGDSRRRIELLNSLIFSLPGTPSLYYGDEIGMGDNIYLGDRNGVRTPMQWSPDRNAGFSSANRQQLYLPVIIDAEFHYETVNVETQRRNPASLLNWMQRLIGIRQRHPVFGGGTLEILEPANQRVFAYLRRDAQETILCVVNLSRFVQPCELDLRRFAGWTPVEMFGQTPFPPIGELPYFLTLGPHSFYWFVIAHGFPVEGYNRGCTRAHNVGAESLRQAGSGGPSSWGVRRG
jgi:maltose alpha-D-glucosyltransferase/alpha-amylase